ncbi:MAG: DUF2784 family protein [bacterium]
MIADFILALHFLIAVFITSGFFIIPVGYKLKWNWCKSFKIRTIHTIAILIVTAETVLGITCPLTSIENSFRGIYNSESFLSYWFREILYWNLPMELFLFVYSVCLIWTIAMWKLFPPKKH